jgi:glycosyltransferase involved in cell wall biosynthesis
MRTLLHAFSTFDLGGAQARFIQLARAFGGRYRHLVVSMDGRAGAGDKLGNEVDWRLMPIANRRGGALANRAAFRAALAEWRPDLLLSYNWGAIEWAAGNLPQRVPQVHVEDGFGPGEAQRQFARRVWTRRLLLGAGHATVVVPSRRLAEHARGWWVPPARLRYIANGVPVAATAQPRPAVPDGRPAVIGTVAVLRAEKNLSRLLRAFAAARQQHALRLIVIGDGPERAALQTLAGQLGIAADVEFTGYLAQPQTRLADIDLFALSSDTEQQPMALLEAMAHGIPVLSTRVGDVHHMLPAEAAAVALCAPDDAAYAQALQQVLACRAEWPAWSAAGLQQVRQHYAHEDMVARWGCVFDGLPDPAPALAPAAVTT